MSCNELGKVADLSRDGMLEMTRSSGDESLDEQLYAATTREVEKGFIEGPIDPKRMPPEATLTRRFRVKQQSKTRPIDDDKASFVNSSVTQLETASVHTMDHIAALVSCALRTAESLGMSLELVAKAWDLVDAYKQVPLSDDAFDMDAFLEVFSPASKGPEMFQQRVVPFGSVASLTAFLRIANALFGK